MKLEVQIIGCWAKEEAPMNASLHTYDDEGTNARFRGTSFDMSSNLELWKYTSSLTFFTNEAFRYYLASYLLYVIRRQNNYLEVVTALKTHLSAPKGDVTRSSYAERVGMLNKHQKACVLDVLEKLISDGVIEKDDPAYRSIKELCM
ncbi:MAG: DUF6714 family protein [Gammaproteobacteria bacterium]